MTEAAEHTYRVLALGLWGAVLWRGLLSRALSPLWWSTVATATAATLQIGSVAAGVEQATGRLYTAALVAHLAAAVAVTLLAGWQLGLTTSAQRAETSLRHLSAALGAVAVALLATWFAAPQRTPPHPGSAFGSHPAMAGHLLILYGYLALLAAVFLRAAATELAVLAPGDTRQALYQLAGAGTLLLMWAGGAAAVQVSDVIGGDLHQGLPGGTHLVLPAAIALFLTGICWTLIGRGRQRSDAAATHRDLLHLWAWLRGAGADRVQPPTERLALLIEIRDLIWQLQRNVPHEHVDQALRIGRHRGLGRGQARAFAAAVCLELGLTARHAGATALRPADLSALGGGLSPRQEAHWLAAVWRATGPAATAASAHILAQLASGMPRAVSQ